MKNRTKRRIFISLILIGLAMFGFIAYATYIYFTNTLPNDEIKNAIESISEAKKAEADKYAKVTFLASEKSLKLAMAEWAIQNEKFFISRDFTKVRFLANKAASLGVEAGKGASIEKDSVSLKLSAQLKRVEIQLKEFESTYKNLPLPMETFKQSARARIKYSEASDTFGKKQYYETQNEAREAERLISQALKLAKNKLSNYYQHFPTWQRNAETARKLSRKGQIVILISKLESTLYVLKSGKTIAQYKAEFGKNWIGDKQYRGDNATPEGIYKIIQIKKGGKTKFYKSLLLNYPNEEDKIEFAALVKKGAISKRARIGDLIQIHGFGGKGVNWTEGCIALKNEEMDKICGMVQLNTPVFIIGSERPLKDYLNQ
jgi:murein L,D-transpeptidase YafK